MTRRNLKQLTVLAKEKRWEELLDAFPGRTGPRGMAKEEAALFYFAFRETGRVEDAADWALDYALQFPNLKLPRDWLEQTIPLLTNRNLSFSDKLKSCSCDWAKPLLIKSLIACRNGVEALFQARTFLVDGPVSGLSRPDIANLFKEAELYEQARDLAWEGLEEGPSKGRCLRILVESLVELSTLQSPAFLDEASALAQTFHRQYPKDADGLFAMGMVWRASARQDLAYPYFKTYFSMYPEDPFRSLFAFDVSYIETLDPKTAFEVRKDWSEIFARLTHNKSTQPLSPLDDPGRRLRIGYISPDFGSHPVGYFARTVLFHHNRSQFDVFLYSHRDPLGGDDAVSRSFREWAGADRWRWVYRMPPRLLLELIRKDRIDLLIDLSGHTKDNRLDVICNRAAPIQISWLGFPASTGCPNMDYRISDAIVEPPGLADDLSSEKIWRLPHGFHAIEMPPNLPEPVAPPCLENGYLTFGSFNNVDKMGVLTCDLWAGLLRAIPKARLLLKHKSMENFSSREGVRSLFAARGVHPSRLRFRGVTPRREDHFAHYGQMDIALDPFGYNGTTTTCEALFMGVPVLTLPGKTHASRVSASLLHRVGLDGWVARDEAHYQLIARAAEAHPEKLQERRTRLRGDFLKSSLSDGKSLAADLETAFRGMWREKCRANPHPPQTTQPN